jgi:hypothetical protein
MDELGAMKAISEQLEKLADPERNRVLAWALSKYAHGGIAAPDLAGSPTKKAGTKPPKNATKTKSPKKAKSVISMDKSLNLSPSGTKSAAEFASEKAPSNVLQKCVVAVYYLRDFLEMENVSVSAVFTYFKTLNWPIPADLRNALQKAGSMGWLDTADAEDIKITTMGENLIEHSLPPKTS